MFWKFSVQKLFAPDVKHPLPLRLFGECFNKEGERQPKQTLLNERDIYKKPNKKIQTPRKEAFFAYVQDVRRRELVLQVTNQNASKENSKASDFLHFTC